MSTVNVFETFDSIQGESSYAGLPCFFIRLAGCNLRCSYCDTPAALETGQDIEIADLVTQAAASPAPLIEITGGEPLLQEGCVELVIRISTIPGKTVLIETNGTQDISVFPTGIVAIMDIKCPGSGMQDAGWEANIPRLRQADEVKFVLTDRADYDWALQQIDRFDLNTHCHAVWFSPAEDTLNAADLGRWMTDDGAPARLQIQLHKILGLK